MKKLIATFLFFLTIFCCSQLLLAPIMLKGQLSPVENLKTVFFSFNEDGSNIIDENDVRYYTIII